MRHEASHDRGVEKGHTEEFPPFLQRHRGLFSPDDISRLRSATVAVAGVGGVGGRVAEILARSGVGSLRLADPDHFTESNLNRQAASTFETIDKNKSLVMAEFCQSVSPIVQTSAYPGGITEVNVHEFVNGATVVVDGTDYTLPSLGLMLARAAAQTKVPVVLGVEVAFAAWHTVFSRTGQFEKFFNLPASTSAGELGQDRGQEIPLWRWIAAVPPYVDVKTLASVQSGEIEAPAIAPAVELSAALLSTDVIRLILGHRPLVEAPKVHMIDARTGIYKTFKPTKVRFQLSILRAILTNA